MRTGECFLQARLQETGQCFALKSLDIFTALFSLLVFILKGSRNISAIYTDRVLGLTWTGGGGREDYVKAAGMV